MQVKLQITEAGKQNGMTRHETTSNLICIVVCCTPTESKHAHIVLSDYLIETNGFSTLLNASEDILEGKSQISTNAGF